jgi:hypothetical protein
MEFDMIDHDIDHKWEYKGYKFSKFKIEEVEVAANKIEYHVFGRRRSFDLPSLIFPDWLFLGRASAREYAENAVKFYVNYPAVKSTRYYSDKGEFTEDTSHPI